jgi:hypothetical protein
VEDEDDELVMLRASELEDLLEAVRQAERARCLHIVIEEGGDLAGELCGIICAEIAEDG